MEEGSRPLSLADGPSPFGASKTRSNLLENAFVGRQEQLSSATALVAGRAAGGRDREQASQYVSCQVGLPRLHVLFAFKLRHLLPV